MPSKPKSRTSKSKLNKKAKVPKWVLGLVLLVFVVIGGFLVYKSFAISYSTSGYMDWSNGNPKYSQSIRSRHGWLCVRTNFDAYNNLWNLQYKWYVEYNFQGNEWVQVRNSQRYQANGNIDVACYDQHIRAGGRYRVKFDPVGGGGHIGAGIHGNYWVYGYNIQGADVESAALNRESSAEATLNAVIKPPEFESPENN